MKTVEELTKMHNIVREFMEDKNFDLLKEYMTSLYENSNDTGELRTILVITKGMKNNESIKDIRVSILNKLETILGHKIN